MDSLQDMSILLSTLSILNHFLFIHTCTNRQFFLSLQLYSKNVCVCVLVGEGHCGLIANSRDRLLPSPFHPIRDDLAAKTQPHLPNAKVTPSFQHFSWLCIVTNRFKLRASAFCRYHDYIFALLCILNVNMGALDIGSGSKDDE